MEIESVSLFTDYVVVRQDPEYAEMGNPSGAIYDQRVMVCATTPAGRRFIHNRMFDVNEADTAARLAALIKDAGRINIDYWYETYEVYGSDAWVEADSQREYQHQSNSYTAGTVRDY